MRSLQANIENEDSKDEKLTVHGYIETGVPSKLLDNGKIEDITEDSIPIINNQELGYNSLTPITFNGLTETILANDDVSYTLVFYILNKNENQIIEDSDKRFRANININSITTGQYINNEINS